jgi:hypothetical protein
MAAMLLNAGEDVRKVQEILGHSSVVTTQVYQAVAPKRQRNTISRLTSKGRLSVSMERPEKASIKKIKTIRRPKAAKLNQAAQPQLSMDLAAKKRPISS